MSGFRGGLAFALVDLGWFQAARGGCDRHSGRFDIHSTLICVATSDSTLLLTCLSLINVVGPWPVFNVDFRFPSGLGGSCPQTTRVRGLLPSQTPCPRSGWWQLPKHQVLAQVFRSRWSGVNYWKLTVYLRAKLECRVFGAVWPLLWWIWGRFR